MPYVHLSERERDVIAQLHFSGTSQAGIARELGRDKGTISRELVRNRVRTGTQRYVRWQYLSSGATKLARQRRALAMTFTPNPDPCVV